MFRLGDEVRWSSQAAGCWKTKVGMIVAVVPAGKPAYEHVPPDSRCKDTRATPRREESYLVQVGGRRMDLYWPRASQLELIHTELPDCCRELIRGKLAVNAICKACDHMVVTASDDRGTKVFRWKLESTYLLGMDGKEIRA